MKKHFILSIISIILLIGNKELHAQMPDSVKNYIDSSLYFMEAKSFFAKNIDWKSIKDSTYYKATGATNYAEAFPALTYAFQQLKDHHGMIANKDTFYRYPTNINYSEILSPGIIKEFLKGNRIVTTTFNSLAYLRVPALHMTKQEEMDKAGNMLRDSLCMLLSKNPEGIIIDLRMNVGGNSAPMQSGIGPLFQNHILGYTVDRDGIFSAPIKIEDGISVDESGNKILSIKNNCSMNPSTPIAVLIGPSTVSSGEILAAFLKQQPNVKLFGEPTSGFCNATQGFLFMKDHGYLLLTVTKIADGNKLVYEDMLVQPDVYVKNDDNYDDLNADPTVKEAINWLSSKKITVE